MLTRCAFTIILAALCHGTLAQQLPPTDCDGQTICTHRPQPAPGPTGVPAPTGAPGRPGPQDPEQEMRTAFESLRRNNPDLVAMVGRSPPPPPPPAPRDTNTCNQQCWHGTPYSIFVPGDGDVLVVQHPGIFEQTIRWCWCGVASTRCFATSPFNSWSGICRAEKNRVKLLVYIPRRGIQLRWVTVDGGCCCTPQRL